MVREFAQFIKERFKFEELSAGNEIFKYKLYIFWVNLHTKKRMPVILSCLACKMTFCPGKSGKFPACSNPASLIDYCGLKIVW